MDSDWELPAPISVRNQESLGTACALLTDAHFPGFQPSYKKCHNSHEVVGYDSLSLVIHKFTEENFNLDTVWSHCISGVILESEERRINVMGLIFSKGKEQRIIYVSLPTEFTEDYTLVAMDFIERVKESLLGKASILCRPSTPTFYNTRIVFEQ